MLKYIVQKNWIISLDPDVKYLMITNYFNFLYSDGPNFNKLFQLFSNLIIDAVMTLNECPDIYSLVQLDNEHQTPSLILIKSMARHFKSIEIDKEEDFEQFCSFFLQSTFQLFIDSQNYTDILLIFDAFYYLISNNSSYFASLDSEIIIAIVSKFIIFSEFQNDDEYQQCLKHASKAIHLLFTKSIIPTDIPSELLISIFTISLQLYTEDLKPSTRNQLTRLIYKLFDYQIIAGYFFSDLENFIDSIFLPFFISTESNVELYEKTFDLYDPYDSSIYLIQNLSDKFTDFVDFINSYLIQFIQHVLDTKDQLQVDDEIMSLLAYTKLVASSLHLSDESILQFPLYESPNEILRFIGFTIAANFSDILPSFLFPVCLDHFDDESEIICRLSAISAIKCLENEELEFDESETSFLPQLFEAYLIITEDPDFISMSTLKLLTRLLDLSDNPGVFSNQILSSLLTRLVNLSNDEKTDGKFVNEISKKICQVIILNSMNQDSELDSDCDTDSFTNELISIYENFNDFFKEQILSIFETLAEFCFSPEISWSIVNVFEFGPIIFEDEMMVLRKLLISAKINTYFEMDAIEYVLDRLFEKIENDIMSALDDEIVLNSLSDIVSSLFGLNDENVDSCINQEMVPLIITGIQMDIQDISASAVSRLISCIFIFFEKCEKELDYQPFINFWIDNSEYPYFCASAIAIFENLTFDLDLCLIVLLKLCDELNDLYKEIDNIQSSDEFEFPEFTLNVIITDFLNLIKYIKDELPEFYQIFHQKAETFLNEILPQIVDYIC